MSPLIYINACPRAGIYAMPLREMADQSQQRLRDKRVSDQREPADVDASPSLVETLERRRPGRLPAVSPTLIPLLRGETEPQPDANERWDRDLAPATGIAVGLVISGAMWVLILSIVWSVSLLVTTG
jgi:hypothetical protein